MRRVEPAAVTQTTDPGPGKTRASSSVVAPAWKRFAARWVYLSVLGAVRAAVWAGDLWHRRRPGQSAGYDGDPRRLLLTGTFYNVGWACSHLPPLSASRAFDRVFVVCDAPIVDFPKITYVSPSPRMVRWLGRTLARALMIWRVSRRERCGALMGYHIMPNALLCLAIGRLLNRRVLYQMTGGPAQVAEGGWRSENALLRLLGGPSPTGKRWLYGLVRAMDDVLVRGAQAESFVRGERLATSCRFLPGSIDTERFTPADAGEPRPFDLVTVGRLAHVKRYDRLIDIMAALVVRRPGARLLVVGEGPLRDELERQRDRLGLQASVEFAGARSEVAHELRRARLFILTSESEGLSIAQIEAMACGLPALAPDIGDLGMLLKHGENGLFIEAREPEQAAEAIASLLADEARMQRYARAAREHAVASCSVPAVAAIWDDLLGAAASAQAVRRPAMRGALPA